MIIQYVDIREHLPKLKINDADPLLLFWQIFQATYKIEEVLSKSHSIKVHLKNKNFIISKIRVFFDAVSAYVSQTNVELSPDANIVDSVVLEVSLVKILQRYANGFSKNEQAAVECLIKSEFEASTSCIEVLSLVDIPFSKFKTQRSKFDTCLNTRFIVPTSNLCGRLFFHALCALSGCCKRMSITLLESQTFLYFNRRFWGINGMNEIVS